MKTYTVSEAREHLAEILNSVERGEEVSITKHGRLIARITHPSVPKQSVAVPPPGFLKAQGWTAEIAADFDAIPEGFEDYS
jgi:antitoxin (DNA-binding transcriptional repressor) of toxin-antitoxin stability system